MNVNYENISIAEVKRYGTGRNIDVLVHVLYHHTPIFILNYDLPYDSRFHRIPCLKFSSIEERRKIWHHIYVMLI